MYNTVGHVVRRGLAAANKFSENPEQPQLPQIPAWGFVLLISTFFFYLMVQTTIGYTFGHVIATHAMIESPSGVLFEPLSTEDPDAIIKSDGDKTDSDKLAAESQELLIVKQKPITANFCSAMKNLRAKGGCGARFRGFSSFIVWGFLVSHLTEFLNITLPRPLAAILATVIFGRLRMTWTHIVISEPSQKPWFRRMATLAAYKKVFVPTLVAAVSEQVAVGVPAVLFLAMGMDKQLEPEAFKKMTCADHKAFAVKVLAIGAVGLFSVITLVIPAHVTLTRVQASTLPDSEETIVPFDRSFDGKVVPEIVGGTGAVSMFDAWKTFSLSSRIRLMKVYVRVFLMHVFSTIFFIAVIGTQLRVVLGHEGLKQARAAVRAGFAREH